MYEMPPFEQLTRSHNSLRAFRADFRLWSEFALQRGIAILPAVTESLVLFFDTKAFGTAPKKYATLVRYRSTIRAVHALMGYPNPIENAEFRKYWDKLASRMPRGQKRLRAISWNEVERIIARLDSEKLIDIRDAALFSLAFESMLKRTEIASLSCSDVEQLPDGSGLIRLDGEPAYLSPTTIGRLNRWMSASGVRHGPLFRSLRSSKHKHVYNDALPPSEIAAIFKKLARSIGINADLIGAHSTRMGGCKELLRYGASVRGTMRAGRWKSAAMVLRYGAERDEETGQPVNVMAELLRSKRR